MQDDVVIDYWQNEELYTVTDLMEDLKKNIESNPHIDFSRIGVSLNDEYMASKAGLQGWEPIGKAGVMRYNLDIT